MSNKTKEKQAKNNKKQAKPEIKLGRNGKLPPVETRFKKGQSGNPKGLTPLTQEEKDIRLLLKKTNETLITQLIKNGSYQEKMELILEIASQHGNITPFKYLNDVSGNVIEEKKESKTQIIMNTLNIFS